MLITQGSLVRNQPDPPSHMSHIDKSCIDVSVLTDAKKSVDGKAMRAKFPLEIRRHIQRPSGFGGVAQLGERLLCKQ